MFIVGDHTSVHPLRDGLGSQVSFAGSASHLYMFPVREWSAKVSQGCGW